MNFAELREYDVTNAPGISATLFVSGCTNECDGCFNKKLWNFNYGDKFDKSIRAKFIKMASNTIVTSISILGGEPLEQGNDMLELVIELSKLNKPIWLWTGYELNDILNNELKKDIVSNVTVLIDGKFVLSKRDLTLKYRGSSNQRVLDAKKSVQFNKPIMYE